MISTVAEHAASSDVARSFNLSLTRLKNQMTLVESDAKQLASALKMISGLADNISSKVIVMYSLLLFFILTFHLWHWFLRGIIARKNALCAPAV